MEIYLIDNAQMFGYIQAILDDENTVEGSFEVRFCNWNLDLFIFFYLQATTH